jgi:hypothetical protein
MATSSPGNWGPCPEGEFRKLAGRLAARHQRRLAFAVLGGIGAVLVTGVTAAAVTQHIMESISASNQNGVCPTHPPVCPPDQKVGSAIPAK